MIEFTCIHCGKPNAVEVPETPIKNPGKVVIEDFIKAFNGLLGTRYRPNESLARNLHARLKEGYSMEDIIQAVTNASEDDFLRGDNQNGRHYLTPEYILRPNKLQEWLNAKPDKSPKQYKFLS